ncbi:MAG: Fic family protein [Candidatus Moraniibacteriota bacterium]
MTKKLLGETTYKQTALGIIPRSQLIPLEVEGIKRAWDFVLQQKVNGRLPVTVSFLKRIHREGFGWIFPEAGGKFRTLEVSVSRHTPPKSYEVPQLMEGFLRDLRVRMRYLPGIDHETFLSELIALLAWAHHWFLWIHPFQDYNGRIGRLLINIILLSYDLPPIELKVETATGRKRYIEALQLADDHRFEKLEQLVSEALNEAVEEISSGQNKK